MQSDTQNTILSFLLSATQNKFLSFFLKEIKVTESLSLQLWMFLAAFVAVVLFVIIIVSVIVSAKKQAKSAHESNSEPLSSDCNQYMPASDEENDSDMSTLGKLDSQLQDNKVLTPNAAILCPSEDISVSMPKQKSVSSPEDCAHLTNQEPENKTATQPDISNVSDTGNKKVSQPQVSNGITQDKQRYTPKEEPVPQSNPATMTKEEEVLAGGAEKDETAKPVVGRAVASGELSQVMDVARSGSEPASSGRAVVGKFEICNSVGGFRYLLLANNGQLLYESRDYKSKDSCRDSIAKFTAAVSAANFKIRADKFGNFKFLLKSPSSANIVYDGESYSTKKACLSAVESLKRFAPISGISDITATDFAVSAMRFEIPVDAVQAVTNGQGAEGRWEIVKSEEDDPKSPFVYLLYANNGQILYESREYRTLDSCKNGINTFVRTLNDGEFIIDKDKFGRFKFILRSKNTSSQAEYYGQNYDNKGACESSAVSVYKFGLLTPVRF